MAVVKIVTMFRSNEGRGWQEIHYRDPGTDTPNLESQLNTYITNVAIKRAMLLGGDCVLEGVRVSYPRAGAVASQSRRVYLPGLTGVTGASQSASLAIPFFDSTRTQHKIMHMRGFWDTVESNESYQPTGGDANGWTTKLNEWKNALTQAPYGWMSKDPALSTKGVVTGYTSQDDGTVIFNVVRDGGAPLVADEQHQIRFSRINKSNSVLNQSLLCFVIDATHVQTAHPIACGPFLSRGRFNLRKTGFVAYAGCEVPSLGMRRMGAPNSRSPGRSKAKARV